MPDVHRVKLAGLFAPAPAACTAAGPRDVRLPGRYPIRMVAAGLLACLIALVALWPTVDAPRPLIVWWALVTAGQLGLASIAHRVRTGSGPSALDEDLGHYLLSFGAVVAGAAWGALPLRGPYTSGTPAQLTLFLLLGGITLGGAAILSASRSAFAVFVLATLLPLFILTVDLPPPNMPHASTGLILFGAFAFAVHDLIHAAHRPRSSPPAATTVGGFEEKILDGAGEAIVLCTGSRIIHHNRRFIELVGERSTHARAEGRLAHWLADASERRRARTALSALCQGRVYRDVVRLRRRDGSIFTAEVSGRALDPHARPLRVVWVATDITERVAGEVRRTMLGTQLQELVSQSGDGYWQTDALHRLVHVHACHAPLDSILDARIGRPWWTQDPRPGVQSDARQTEIRQIFEDRGAFRDLMVEVRDGYHPPRWLTLSGTPRQDEHGCFLGYHGIAVDVTERVRGTERIRHLAYHDALTGLPNRRLLVDRLGQAIERAQRYRERLGVILIDLDDFKRINDLSGHSVGDRVLLDTADRLRACIRPCDTVARLGSDEFVVLLSELDQPSDADQMAGTILHALGQPVAGRLGSAPLGTSIGIALYPEDAQTADSLLEVADRRMYRAKRRGGQTIEHV